MKENIYLTTHYIPDSRVGIYFSAADVCVLPYRSATQSGVSSVAYHFEVPMITTAAGGLKETIGDRGTGMIVDRPDPDAVASAIRIYFGDAPAPEGRPGGETARDEMLKNIIREKDRLSWSNFCNKLMEFYRTL